MTKKTEILQQGAELLAPEVVPHGFAFQLGGSGQSSGGDFAFGNFLRGEWRLELHFRYSLGLVAYPLAALLSRSDFMREFLMFATLAPTSGGSAPSH